MDNQNNIQSCVLSSNQILFPAQSLQNDLLCVFTHPYTQTKDSEHQTPMYNDQSEASICVTWPALANQKPDTEVWTNDMEPRPAIGHFWGGSHGCSILHTSCFFVSQHVYRQRHSQNHELQFAYKASCFKTFLNLIEVGWIMAYCITKRNNIWTTQNFDFLLGDSTFGDFFTTLIETWFGLWIWTQGCQLIFRSYKIW